MLIGLHISIAGGIYKAPIRAGVLGCETFQIFTRSPHGGAYDVKFSSGVVEQFKKECEKYKLTDYYIHCPYYINLASSNNRIYFGSISSIKKELEIANLINAKAVVVHLGSAKDLGKDEAIKKTIEGINLVLEEYSGDARLLIEISAGAGKIIGDSFEEITRIIYRTHKKEYLGVCFDTAHSFASGYDLRDFERVKNVFTEFDKKIGLNKLELIHCNDSKSAFGSHIDRHEHIGEGKIGYDGLKAVVDFAKLYNINIIAETPYKKEGDDKRNLEVLKEMREKVV